MKAYFPPKATTWAYQIYSFLKQNDGHVLLAGGMGHVVMGLDRVALAALAPHYGIDYSQIIPFVNFYESQILKQQSLRTESP